MAIWGSNQRCTTCQIGQQFLLLEQLLEDARAGDVALLVVGDPFGATTHADLVMRARELGVLVKVVSRNWQKIPDPLN